MATTKIEKYTEKLTEQEMKISEYGENDFGVVYVQGETTPNSNINEALKKQAANPKIAVWMIFLPQVPERQNPNMLSR